MHRTIDRMLREYESGQISRRGLLGGIALLMASRQVSASASPFRATSLNHVTIQVSDLQKSKTFYTKLLGLPIIHDYPERTPPSSYLGLGTSFLCIEPGKTTGIDHFCVGLPSYSPKEATRKLQSEGVHPETEDDQVYFRDPDGVRVQLASADYNG